MQAFKGSSHSKRVSFVSAIILAAFAGDVSAGGFAIREQSSSFMGSSFAGNAAGGDLSSMYWNSAALGLLDAPRKVEGHAALILPDSEITAQAGTTPTLPNIGVSTEIGNWAIVGSTYAGYQVSPTINIGVAINSPYGLVTEPEDRNWAGQYHNRTSKLFTTTVNPVASIKLGPKVIFGAGAQINYSRVTLKTNPSFATPNENSTSLTGDDYAFGYTVGAIVMPFEGTRVGIGYRSSLSLNIEGDVRVAGDFASGVVIGNQLFAPVDVHADLPLPQILTLSLNQAITQNIRLLGTVEWTHWSKLGTVPVVAQSTGGLVNAAPIVGPITPGRTVTTLEFEWDDGWFYSVGGELDVNDRLTLRSGVAWEESPVDNATQRSTAVPDSDRVWLSFGGTFDYNERIALDLAYTHIWFATGPIERNAAASALTGLGVTSSVTLVGEAKTSTDIIAGSVKIKLGGTEG